jgi:hypothetical protein
MHRGRSISRSLAQAFHALRLGVIVMLCVRCDPLGEARRGWAGRAWTRATPRHAASSTAPHPAHTYHGDTVTVSGPPSVSEHIPPFPTDAVFMSVGITWSTTARLSLCE